MSRAALSDLLRRFLTALLCLGAASVARAQLDTGAEYVSFWRGDFRIFASEADTRVTLIDINTGAPLAPGSWFGNFATNPFVLTNPGDSFEASSGSATLRVLIQAEDATGAGAPKPIVVWTGDVAASMIHPTNPPGNQNAWASYIPDIVQPGLSGGSELGNTFLGFTTRDLIVIVEKAGGSPVQVVIQDLLTNTDTDTDDTGVLTRTDAALDYEDAEIEIYRLNGFEDDTIRVTVTGGRASVLAGIWSSSFTDWSMTPPSYLPTQNGRELGTRFYFFASRWLTIFPVFNDTSVTVTDLSDGDDSETVWLAQGERFSPNFDIYIADVTGAAGQSAAPRTDFPVVNFHEPAGGRIDDDYVKVESTRPVLVYVGAVSSNVNEFADVAYAVPVGPTQRLIHAYAQNGGAQDLQIFAFDELNPVNIRSVTFTLGFRGTGHHDFNLPLATPWIGGNSTTNHWYWSSAIWDAEILRIGSQGPLQVMNGDYDGPSFGAFIPFVPVGLTEPPVADAGPDLAACPNELLDLSGSGSFDVDVQPGGMPESWEWDLDVAVDSDGDGTFDNDVDATGENIQAAFPPGNTIIKLTYTDDDGEVAVDFLRIMVGDFEAPVLACPPHFRALATDYDGGDVSPVVDALDECDSSPFVSNDRTAGGRDATDFYPCGVTSVTWTAMDASGHEVTCTSAVVVEPEGGFPSIGPVLRVSKLGGDRPLLDWSMVAGLPPDSRYVVLRAGSSDTIRAAAPVAPELVSTMWLDPMAVGKLLFYDVRYVKCDGGSGGDD